MHVVDSSCWLEYFADSAVGNTVAPIIAVPNELIVPSITIHEVFKKLLVEQGEDAAIFTAAHLNQGRVIDLDADLAMHAARCGKDHKLPMADSIIYATAQKFDATLWTQDSHFEGLELVKYFPKNKNSA